MIVTVISAEFSAITQFTQHHYFTNVSEICIEGSLIEKVTVLSTYAPRYWQHIPRSRPMTISDA
jgi:hypothetical protein